MLIYSGIQQLGDKSQAAQGWDRQLLHQEPKEVVRKSGQSSSSLNTWTLSASGLCLSVSSAHPIGRISVDKLAARQNVRLVCDRKTHLGSTTRLTWPRSFAAGMVRPVLLLAPPTSLSVNDQPVPQLHSYRTSLLGDVHNYTFSLLAVPVLLQLATAGKRQLFNSSRLGRGAFRLQSFQFICLCNTQVPKLLANILGLQRPRLTCQVFDSG